jgi:hypothetical protein
MPYIRKIEREQLDKNIDELSKIIDHDGQLNYVITRLCHNWIIKVGKKYTRINQIMGVLQCATLEFYRMIAVPYENIKKRENGRITYIEGI